RRVPLKGFRDASYIASPFSQASLGANSIRLAINCPPFEELRRIQSGNERNKARSWDWGGGIDGPCLWERSDCSVAGRRGGVQGQQGEVRPKIEVAIARRYNPPMPISKEVDNA
ncbi:MAG: hypothetical protein L0312_24055, partial [Acidobacteria bacterium]|nr:hypothetical protein [Acidobacteriota bacterium]